MIDLTPLLPHLKTRLDKRPILMTDAAQEYVSAELARYSCQLTPKELSFIADSVDRFLLRDFAKSHPWWTTQKTHLVDGMVILGDKLPDGKREVRYVLSVYFSLSFKPGSIVLCIRDEAEPLPEDYEVQRLLRDAEELYRNYDDLNALGLW
jgi:hypothetical protein